MGKRGRAHVLWTEGTAAFAFLVEQHGFLGPELVEDGIRYHRRGPLSAELSCLYVACRLGPLQAVGGSAGTVASAWRGLTRNLTKRSSQPGQAVPG